MWYQDEHFKKMNELCKKLEDLQEGKKVIERAMHNNFYHRGDYGHLFDKCQEMNQRIKDCKKEIAKERKRHEKSR